MMEIIDTIYHWVGPLALWISGACFVIMIDYKRRGDFKKATENMLISVFSGIPAFLWYWSQSN